MPRLRFSIRRMMVAVAILGFVAAWAVHMRALAHGHGDVPGVDSPTSAMITETLLVASLSSFACAIAMSASRPK